MVKRDVELGGNPRGNEYTMKAWKVGPKGEFYSTVVFAETRGKALSMAMHTYCCEDCSFLDIEVQRYKCADSEYHGYSEMDWNNEKDRLFLVKECGWQCVEDIVGEECEDCCAKEYCGAYNALKERDSSE